MHDVVPRAVKIAVATDAMICTMNFSVSFFVMILIFNNKRRGRGPWRLISVVGQTTAGLTGG